MSTPKRRALYTCGIRQQSAIDGVLPTFLGVSSGSATDVTISLLGFVVLYSTLAVVDVFLMRRSIKAGPEGLAYWPMKGHDPSKAHPAITD